MKISLPAMLATCVLLGAGCFSPDVHQVYLGEPQPPEKTCTLLVPGLLEIRAIDGVPADWRLRIKRASMQELSLLAGSHYVLVKYYDPTADESRHEVYEDAPVVITFLGDCGSVHELKYETALQHPELRSAGRKVHIWAAQVHPGLHAPPAALENSHNK